MPRPGPPYSPEFRADAVRLLRSSGKTVAELSRELGVSEPTLRRWRHQADDDRREAAGEVRRRRLNSLSTTKERTDPCGYWRGSPRR